MIKVVLTRKYYRYGSCKHCGGKFKKNEEIVRVISKGKIEESSEQILISLHKKCFKETLQNKKKQSVKLQKSPKVVIC